ncbi:CoA pyrophosphatase [bacterium 210820-DFI.6.37]|nr:CoA pyrophosphatase [bacterium 210820-DFI.6.37]
MTSQINLDKIKSVFYGRSPGTIGKHSFFSVLVPLIETSKQLCLLYEVRAEHMKRQPGEICFPGGQVEDGETFEACAVRETIEELGIRREDIQIISQMDVLYTYSNFTMFPFLGTIKEEALSRMNRNPDEVKETFLVPLSWLLEQEPFVYRAKVSPAIGEDFPYERIKFPKGYKWRSGISEVPIYDFEGRIIWGLTGRITRNFIEVLKDKEAEHV